MFSSAVLFWRKRWRLLLAAAAWAIAGGARGAPPLLVGAFGPSRGSFDPAGTRALARQLPLWDSMNTLGSNQGVFQWGPFRLGSTFAVYVAGTLGDEGVTLYWQDAGTGQRLLLAPRNPPGDRWTLYRWRPPAAWVGRTVYLGAENHSNSAWIGVSAPVLAEASGTRAFGLGVRHLALFSLLLLPGFGVAALGLRGRPEAPELFLTLALVASGTAAYAVFWMYELGHGAGVAASAAVLLAGAAGLLAGRGPALRGVLRELAWPLALTAAAGLLYEAALLLYGGLESPAIVGIDRYIHLLPPDPLLPYWLGDRIFTGTSLHPFFADWLASDRPPLQAAFQLLFAPLSASQTTYQILATGLQTWVFLGAWVLLRLARIPARTTAWVLSFLIFSGFFLLNSTYVWPKLLPAAYLLLAAALLWYRPGQAAGRVGACAGLAMMAHGGSAFGLLGLGIVFAGSRGPGRVRFCAVAAAVLAAYVLPWSWYQHAIDPPGNRLLKWHLAGVIAPDGRSFPRTLADSYRALSFPAWVHAKAYNLRALVTDDGSRLGQNLAEAAALARQGRVSAAGRQAAYALRLGGMLHLLQSPAFLDLGAAGLVILARRRRAAGPEWALARRCLLLAAACTAGWCLLMFSPASTVNHQGTYLTNAALFVALGLGVTALPPAARWLLAAANLAFFLSIWVFSAARADYTPALLTAADPACFGVFLFGLAATLGCLRGLGSGAEPANAPPAA